VNGKGGRKCGHGQLPLANAVLFTCNESVYRAGGAVCATNGDPWCRTCLRQTNHRWCRPDERFVRHRKIISMLARPLFHIRMIFGFWCCSSL
jgi:hypothetical protein